MGKMMCSQMIKSHLLNSLVTLQGAGAGSMPDLMIMEKIRLTEQFSLSPHATALIIKIALCVDDMFIHSCSRWKLRRDQRKQVIQSAYLCSTQ
jgi:hypothetical protein